MSLCIISMIFQHFAHSILLMMFLHFVPQFITVDLYFFNTASLLTLEFHIFALSTCNQGQFLPIKISGDMHVTTSCCLTVRISNQIAYILQMARSNALTCIYSGTKCNTREVIYLNRQRILAIFCSGKCQVVQHTMDHLEVIRFVFIAPAPGNIQLLLSIVLHQYERLTQLTPSDNTNLHTLGRLQ